MNCGFEHFAVLAIRREKLTVQSLDFDDLFSVADYGPGWRKHRSAFHQHFHMGVTKRYHDILGHFARRHLIQLSEGGNLIETTRKSVIDVCCRGPPV